MTSPAPISLRLLALAGICLLAAHPAQAQLPKLPGGVATGSPQPEAANPAEPENPAKTRARLAALLQTARGSLASLDAPGPGAIPATITPGEIAELRFNLIRVAFNLERHLKILDGTEAAKATAAEAQRREQEWKKFPQAPPFSFLFYDELRNQRDAAITRLDSFKATTALLERQMAIQRESCLEAERASQLAADKAARAKGGENEAAAMWRLESSRILLQSQETSLSFLQISINAHLPKMAEATADLALVERQIAAIGTRITFTDEDLATASAAGRAKSAATEKELLAIAHRHDKLLTERDQLRAEVEKLRAQQPETPGSDPPPQLAVTEERLRAVNAEEESTSFSISLLEAMQRLYTDIPEALQLRRQLLAGNSAEERLEARRKLQELQTTVAVWRSFVDNERAATSAAVREQDSKLASLPADSPNRAMAQRVLDAHRHKIEVVDRLDQLVTDVNRSITRWVADDTKSQAERSFSQRASDSLSKIWATVAEVWNFPVYSFTDTVELNGQTVRINRGVSLGRLLGALLFFIIAYRSAAIIAKRLQRSVVQRGWVDGGQTLTWRRWGMVVVGTMLALFTLHLLKIPLTAFAFLGGALAIGFGFGTQTIFKNLISGVIVLAERKIRVGDILDVDGIIGKVTSVDTRSSTVRGFDGVETLIPNSLLLENKVTNWTHSNARQRRTVRVGVAYGSPLQRVSEIMSDCAVRHGLVLGDPPPLVLFEDFGADSLVFALLFWVELKDSTNANQIASDLRFMLDKRLSEAGIVIAFPQRDIHLNSPQPLQFQMVPPESAPAGKPRLPE